MWKLQVDDNDDIERHTLSKNEDGTYNVDDEEKNYSLEDAIRRIQEK